HGDVVAAELCADPGIVLHRWIVTRQDAFDRSFDAHVARLTAEQDREGEVDQYDHVREADEQLSRVAHRRRGYTAAARARPSSRAARGIRSFAAATPRLDRLVCAAVTPGRALASTPRTCG